MSKGKGKRIRELEAENARLHGVIDALSRRDQQPQDVIKGLLEGITPLFLGYRDGESKKQSNIQEIITAMGSQGLDERAGVGEGQWYPEVEFDEHMESPNRWPQENKISSITPIPVGNGQRTETDGEPLHLQDFEGG